MSKIQSFFNSNSKLPYLVLFVVGALNVIAFSPFNIWFYSPVSVAILAVALTSPISTKKAFRFGFSYGLGWFATGISWVHVAIADFGGLPLPISILLLAILDAYLALFPAIACWLAVRFKSQLGHWALLPAWMLAEWLRSVLLTGFPWLSLGYSQTTSPLSGLAPVIGEIGLQAVVIILGLCIARISYCLVQNKQTRGAVFPATIVVALLSAGYALQQVSWSNNTGKQVNISLVQGNIKQSVKWQPDNEFPTMEKYLGLSQSEFEFADVIIWPEAAIPRFEIIANDFLREVDQLAASTSTALVTGIVDYQPETNMAFNNLIVLGKKYREDEFGHYKYLHNNRFSKHHLLPIGEYVPFESLLRNLAPIFDLPMSSFSRGTYQQDNLIANGINLSPAICFEIAFSDQVRTNLYQGQNRSDLILTVSNDAWFGDSHGPWQHLQIAQMRALEYAMPVVRVTNNGVTVFINERGKISEILPQFEAGALRKQLQISKAFTPYQQFGNLPVLVLLLLFTFALLLNNKKRFTEKENSRMVQPD